MKTLGTSQAKCTIQHLQAPSCLITDAQFRLSPALAQPVRWIFITIFFAFFALSFHFIHLLAVPSTHLFQRATVFALLAPVPFLSRLDHLSCLFTTTNNTQVRPSHQTQRYCHFHLEPPDIAQRAPSTLLPLITNNHPLISS